MEPLLENKAFPQQRFSPVSGVGGISGVASVKHVPSACRPKPIKARSVYSLIIVNTSYNHQKEFFANCLFLVSGFLKVGWMLPVNYMVQVVTNLLQQMVYPIRITLL